MDADGVPLGARLSPAKAHDSRLLEPLIDAVPPIRRGAGRPRRRPSEEAARRQGPRPPPLHCRRACRRRGIVPRIARPRRGVASGERLGRHRWVVERTLAWFARYRRLATRYQRRADLFEASHHLAASLICLKFAQRWFC